MKELNPYFRLFHGERVNDSQLKAEASFAGRECQTLFKEGKMVGQVTLDGDIVWWMPSKVKEI
ncbi:MAG: hypothetical protein AABY15_07645 [Nanoarchaeota archaeon]